MARLGKDKVFVMLCLVCTHISMRRAPHPQTKTTKCISLAVPMLMCSYICWNELFVLKRQKLKAMKRKDEWNKLKLMARDAEEKRMARDAEEKRMKLDSVEKNAGAH